MRLAAAVAYDFQDRHARLMPTLDLCTIVVSLQLAQATLAALAQEHVHSVHMLLLTDEARLGNETRTFFIARAVRVVDVMSSDAMRRFATMRFPGAMVGCIGSACFKGAKYKLAALWQTNYDRVMLTDVDNLLLPAAANGTGAGALEGLEAGMIRAPVSKDGTPFIANWWLTRPATRWHARFDEAISRGWSPCTHWGGHYSNDTVEVFTKGTEGPPNKRWYPAVGAWWGASGCGTDVARARSGGDGTVGECAQRPCFAGFFGANTDQGILAHLVFDERYRGWADTLDFDRSSRGHPWTMMFSFRGTFLMAMAHFAGPQKPWDDLAQRRGHQHAYNVTHAAERHAAFWRFYWPHVIMPDLKRRHDDTCIREYETLGRERELGGRQ